MESHTWGAEEAGRGSALIVVIGGGPGKVFFLLPLIMSFQNRSVALHRDGPLTEASKRVVTGQFLS